MDEKQTKSKAPVSAPKKEKSGGIREYFRGVRTEIKKVVWPTRKELVSYTGVVIFACTVFAIGFFFVDGALLLGLKHLLNFTF